MVRYYLRPSQILAPSRRDARPEHRTPHFRIRLVKGAHDGLDPILVHLGKEHLDGLLGRRAGRVGADGRGRPRGAPRRGDGRLVKEEELDVGARDET